MVDMAAQSGRMMHLGEGKAREGRDRLLEDWQKGGVRGAKVADRSGGVEDYV